MFFKATFKDIEYTRKTWCDRKMKSVWLSGLSCVTEYLTEVHFTFFSTFPSFRFHFNFQRRDMTGGGRKWNVCDWVADWSAFHDCQVPTNPIKSDLNEVAQSQNSIRESKHQNSSSSQSIVFMTQIKIQNPNQVKWMNTHAISQSE